MIVFPSPLVFLYHSSEALDIIFGYTCAIWLYMCKSEFNMTQQWYLSAGIPQCSNGRSHIPSQSSSCCFPLCPVCRPRCAALLIPPTRGHRAGQVIC